jgi:hypothetical protein
MLVLNCDIKIGSYTFKAVHQVEINSSWENLTDTCKLTIPRKLSWNKNIVEGNSIFKKGDSVTVKLGYNGELHTIFEGFISGIKPSTPLEILCEDKMWKLKQITIPKFSKGKTTLKNLLSAIIPEGIEYNTDVDIELGSFRISNASVAKVLEKLKKDYNIYSYFKNNKLFCGLAFYPSIQKKKKFVFQEVVIDSDLEYLKEEDIKIKVKAISMTSDNRKIEAEVGSTDLDADIRTLHFYDIKDKENLEETARRYLDKFKYEGFRGTFETFGWPVARHGDIAAVVDKKYPEKNGDYLIKSVTTTFGVSGYRQSITLDAKV